MRKQSMATTFGVLLAALASVSVSAHAQNNVVGWGRWSDTNNSPTPAEVPPGTFTKMAAGFNHALGLKSDGTVAAWGYNTQGQACPEGNAPPCVVTLNGQPLTNVVDIAASDHSLAVLSDFVAADGTHINGAVVGWGRNISGEACGRQSVSGQPVPRPCVVTFENGQVLSNVKAVYTGTYYSIAVKNDGTVVGWGNDDADQSCPDGHFYHSNPFNLAAPCVWGINNPKKIAAGGNFTVVLKQDNTVAYTGAYTNPNYAPPSTQVASVKDIAAIQTRFVFLKSDGTIVNWGSGNVPNPGQATDAIAIAAGLQHTLALKSDHTVAAWWDPNAPNQTSPPASLAGVNAIAANYNYGLALKATTTPTLPSGLVSRWAAGTTNDVPDAQGKNPGILLNGATGMPQNAATVAPKSVGEGYAFKLDGYDDVIAIQDNNTDPAATLSHQSFTYAAWIYPAGMPRNTCCGGERIFSTFGILRDVNGNFSVGAGAVVDVARESELVTGGDANKLLLTTLFYKFPAGYVDIFDRTVPIQIGKWTHVALTVNYNQNNNTGTVAVYINGVALDNLQNWSPANTSFTGTFSDPVRYVPSGTEAAHLTPNRAWIGGQGYWHNWYGELNEIAVWNRALNGAEIMSLYNLQRPAHPLQ